MPAITTKVAVANPNSAGIVSGESAGFSGFSVVWLDSVIVVASERWKNIMLWVKWLLIRLKFDERVESGRVATKNDYREDARKQTGWISFNEVTTGKLGVSCERASDPEEAENGLAFGVSGRLSMHFGDEVDHVDPQATATDLPMASVVAGDQSSASPFSSLAYQASWRNNGWRERWGRSNALEERPLVGERLRHLSGLEKFAANSPPNRQHQCHVVGAREVVANDGCDLVGLLVIFFDVLRADSAFSERKKKSP